MRVNDLTSGRRHKGSNSYDSSTSTLAVHWRGSMFGCCEADILVAVLDVDSLAERGW